MSEVALKFKDIVKYRANGRLYSVSIESTKEGTVVIQDIESLMYREVPRNMLALYSVRERETAFYKFDRVFIENHKTSKLFIVKNYYEGPKKLEVFPLGQTNCTFYIDKRHVKLAGELA